ncbi:hypothetical protein K7X08_006301 [Anisodus acutangulus]|uniref:Late embryogenesis abundant protein LEA-2 subgroup domain-containing protein n=1 Tax=Anisodus acutangulus TaxID=402998 RepID=A0A9Q1MV31_9SOLA|nr:hypothetical protein K7X08_006301 [Anisodus acutangulus]
MYRQHETNPYFVPPHVPPLEQREPQHPPYSSQFPPVLPSNTKDQTPQPHSPDDSYFPSPTMPVSTRHPHPQLHSGPRHQPHSGHASHVPPPRHQPHFGHDSHLPTPVPPPRHQPHSGSRPHGQHHRHSSGLVRVTTRRKTRPFAWLVAGFCALFWVMVIVAGLAILIIYLVFRPRNPKFDITSVTLNAAYLDMGYLLNADITVLANFTNPNKKGRVDFHYAILDLYHGGHLLASSYIDPFSTMSHESRFQDVHLVSSQVRLPLENSQQLKKEVDNGRVKFEVKGLFRARSNLGSFLQYSYWLYSRCTIVVTSPPTGVLIGRRCVTKR